MTKDLFFDLLEENDNLTDYDLKEIVNVVEEAVDAYDGVRVPLASD